jgi:hypothetical protein
MSSSPYSPGKMNPVAIHCETPVPGKEPMRSWVVFTDTPGMNPNEIRDHHQDFVGDHPGKNDRFHQSGITTSSIGSMPEPV